MTCPNCAFADSVHIQSKYLVAELRQCNRCRIYFRYPLDSNADNFHFYQESYDEPGFTTSLPSDSNLASLIETGFRGTEKDYAGLIKVLNSLGLPKQARIIDFGCSWGFGTWQLQNAGFQTVGYEISKPRAAFAREKMNLSVYDEMSMVEGGFDVFFSSHVLEHVPCVNNAIAIARKLLRPGGLFVAITPNGSAPFRKQNEALFHSGWGKSHPNVLSDEFYRTVFSACPLFLNSTPYDYKAISDWNKTDSLSLDVSGFELLAVAVL